MQKIEIIEEESNIYGFITSLDEESAFDYLNIFFSDEQIVELKSWLTNKKIYEFAVLRNIYVDEDNRGHGVGKFLVAQFASQTKGLPILLLASPDEDNFLLDQWYLKLGFEMSSFSCSDGPLMIKI